MTGTMKEASEGQDLLNLYEKLRELSERQIAALLEDRVEKLQDLFMERERSLGAIKKILDDKSVRYPERVILRIKFQIAVILATDERLRSKLEEKKEEILVRLSNLRKGQKMLKAYKPFQVSIPKFIEKRG